MNLLRSHDKNTQALSLFDIGHILEFLSTVEAIRLSRVCRQWYQAVFYAVHDIAIDGHTLVQSKFDSRMMEAGLQKFRKLYTLCISNCSLTDDGIQAVLDKNSPDLTSVAIDRSLLKNLSFGNYTRLQKLSLTRCKELGAFRLNGCIQLRVLDLSQSFMLDAHLQQALKDLSEAVTRAPYLDTRRNTTLPNEPPLQILTLAGCKNIQLVQFPGYDCDGRMLSNLLFLDLSNTAVIDETLENLLRQLPRLCKLNLSLCNGLRNCALVHPELQVLSMRNCRQLRRVKLGGCPKLTRVDLTRTPLDSDVIGRIFRDNPGIHILDISEAYNLQDVNLGDFLQAQHPSASSAYSGPPHEAQLDTRELNLSYTNVHDDFVDQICARSSNLLNLLLRQTLIVQPRIQSDSLRVLDCSDTGLTDTALENIIRDCKSLVYLSVSSCQNVRRPRIAHDALQVVKIGSTLIRDESVEYLINNCPSLQKLDVSGSDSLVDIRVNSHTLKQLNVLRCHRLRSIAIVCKSLETLFLEGCYSLSEWEFGSLPSLRTVRVDPMRIQLVASLRAAAPSNLEVRSEQVSPIHKRSHVLTEMGNFGRHDWFDCVDLS